MQRSLPQCGRGCRCFGSGADDFAERFLGFEGPGSTWLSILTMFMCVYMRLYNAYVELHQGLCHCWNVSLAALYRFECDICGHCWLYNGIQVTAYIWSRRVVAAVPVAEFIPELTKGHMHGVITCSLDARKFLATGLLVNCVQRNTGQYVSRFLSAGEFPSNLAKSCHASGKYIYIYIYIFSRVHVHMHK